MRLTLFAAIAATLLSIPGAAAPPDPPWRAAPEYLPLITAAQAPPGTYAVYTSPRPIAEALRALERDPGRLHAPGAWTPQPLVALDAFGKTGSYNRWALARLYGARPARIARGPHGADGRVEESWTLISPYPDPAMRELHEGTLLVVLRLP